MTGRTDHRMSCWKISKSLEVLGECKKKAKKEKKVSNGNRNTLEARGAIRDKRTQKEGKRAGHVRCLVWGTK